MKYNVISWKKAKKTKFYDNNKKTVCDINKEYWKEINLCDFDAYGAYTAIYSDDDFYITSNKYDWVLPYELLIEIKNN